MACGTPVIAFKKRSMPKIITSDINGFMSSNTDEAIDCCKHLDSLNRADCGKNG
jgi:glycosyltransferase involved in cell wall biosynthesis